MAFTLLVANYYFDVQVKKSFSESEKYIEFLKKRKERYSYTKTEENVIFTIKREGIKFIDNMNLFCYSLKKLGELIGTRKLELPQSYDDVEKMKIYNINDCKIIIQGIKFLKRKLADDKIVVKRLITMNQIAIAYILKRLYEDYEGRKIFYHEGKIWQSKYREIIREAYRGGRVEVFKFGVTRRVKYIDINSLYPYCMCNIKFPDLNKEMFYNHPKKEYWNKLISRIGVCKVLVKNVNNKLGFLPIRTSEGIVYPKENSYLLGIYTNSEIKRALEEGYELINMEYCIVYDELTSNPFSRIIPELYEKRTKDKERRFEYYFYKSIMNFASGKFGQCKKNREIVFGDIEETGELGEKGYINLGGITPGNLLCKFQKEEEELNYKGFYCPLLIALITSKGREIIYETYKKIGVENMVYSDTDSAIFKSSDNLPEGINIGDKMGEFKVVKENFDIEVFGKKSYIDLSNYEAKMCGVRFGKYDKYKKTISFTRMNGIKKNETGKFINYEKDLREQTRKNLEKLEENKNRKVYIDLCTSKNNNQIDYFIDDLKKVGENA